VWCGCCRRVLCCCSVVLVGSCVVWFALCVCVCDLFLFLQAKRIFFLGPNGSGTFFHSHSHTVNALVHGVKHWILLPPGAPYGAQVRCSMHICVYGCISMLRYRSFLRYSFLRTRFLFSDNIRRQHIHICICICMCHTGSCCHQAPYTERRYVDI